MIPEISIIIPCYNRAVILKKTLSAYDRQIPVEGGFEIIAIDDGSTDGTLDILKEWSPKGYDLRYLSQENAGPGKARNKGIKIARGNYILITGDDVIPSNNFISVHLKKHRELNNADFAVLGKMDWDHDIAISTVMLHITGIGAQQFRYHFLIPETFVDFRHFYTSNISLHKEILLRCDHLFDTDFEKPAFEDIELGYRLQKNGMKIYYTDKALAVHNHFYSAKVFCQRQYNAGLMSDILIKKHPELEKEILGNYKKSRQLISFLPSIKKNRDLLFSNKQSISDFEDAIIRLVMHYEFSFNPHLDAIYISLFDYFFDRGYAESSFDEKTARRFYESMAIFKLFPDVLNFINSNRKAQIILPSSEAYFLEYNLKKIIPLSLFERSIFSFADKLKKLKGSQ